MKAVGIVILFPLISVVIVSLYVYGGASRTAAMVLLLVFLLGLLARFFWKRTSRENV